MSDQSKPNIVQVELFPPRGILKTEVRFYDDLGITTDLVANHSLAKSAFDANMAVVLFFEETKRTPLYTAMEAARRTMNACERDGKALILGYVWAAAKEQKPLAVRYPGASMASLVDADNNPEEYPKIFEVVKNAASQWIFVFPWDDLRSENHKNIISMM